MSFQSDIARFADKVGENINEVRREAAMDIFRRVIERSPVGDPDYWKSKYKPKGYIGGTFRGNWQASLGAPMMGVLSSKDKTGQTTIAKAVKVANSAQGDDTIWLVNNLPYAQRLEYGWSKRQAPKGMVRLSIQEFKRAIDAQIRRLK